MGLGVTFSGTTLTFHVISPSGTGSNRGSVVSVMLVPGLRLALTESSDRRFQMAGEVDVGVGRDFGDVGAGSAEKFGLNPGATAAIGAANARLDIWSLVAKSNALADWPSMGSRFGTTFSTGYWIAESDSSNGVIEWLNVLSVDGVVSSATRSDSTGNIGASVTLADGTVVLARFPQSPAFTATIQITDPSSLANLQPSTTYALTGAATASARSNAFGHLAFQSTNAGTITVQ